MNQITKHIFLSEKQRSDFLIETVLLALTKACNHGYSPKLVFERECLKKQWIALSMIYCSIMKGKNGQRFCNALSDLPDNADKEEKLIELLKKMEKMKYFRLGGEFNKKYYFYRISSNLEIKL